MESSVLWIILIVLCIVTAVVMRFASKALSQHNNDRQAIIAELEKLKKLKDKYKNLSAELVDEAEPQELLEGVTAVMQAQVEKSEDVSELFGSFSASQKYAYTLNYFVEDVRTSLSFFFKNNGEPLTVLIVPALEEVGADDILPMVKAEYEMYDDNNEEVSVSVDKMQDIDEKFKSVYDENTLLCSVKQYIEKNTDKF